MKVLEGYCLGVSGIWSAGLVVREENCMWKRQSKDEPEPAKAVCPHGDKLEAAPASHISVVTVWGTCSRNWHPLLGTRMSACPRMWTS